MSQANKRMLIVHADDLGLAGPFNEGVREAYKNGLLTSTSVRSNGSAFEEAVDEIIPDCPGLGVGIHLNIVEGRSQRANIGKATRIYDSEGYYKASFSSLFRAYLSGDESTFVEVEADCRTQIEMVLARGITPDHLSTHRHSHGIPAMFETLCKLAREYKIPFVRLPRERFYVAEGIGFHLGIWYPINVAKHFLLNVLSRRNAATAKRLGVRTNDYLVGVTYTGHMTARTLSAGLASLSSARSGIVEVLLHPCKVLPDRNEKYTSPYLGWYVASSARTAELSALLDLNARRLMEEDGWELTSYSRLAANAAGDNSSSVVIPVDSSCPGRRGGQ